MGVVAVVGGGARLQGVEGGAGAGHGGYPHLDVV